MIEENKSYLEMARTWWSNDRPDVGFLYPEGQSVLGTDFVESTWSYLFQDTKVPPFDLVMSFPHI